MPDNQDTDPKMVPEKDLIAVKKGAEKDIAALQSQLTAKETEHKAAIDKAHADLLQERAAKEQFESQLKSQSVISPEEMTAIKGQLEAATTRGEAAEAKLLELRKEGLVQQHGLTPDSLKDMPPAEVEAVEKALKLLGSVSPRQKFATDGGGGEPTMTARDKMKAGIEAYKAK